MDHLPSPQNPLHPPIEVRLLEAEGYDGLDFVTYPERQGWDERTAEDWLDIFRRPPRRFRAFLERWLLFGPLAIFFGTTFDTRDFIRFVGDPAYPVFTTENYVVLLKRFNAQLKAGSAVLFGAGANSTISLNGSITIQHILGYSDEKESYSGRLGGKTSLFYFLNQHPCLPQDPRSPEVVLATSVMLEGMIYYVNACVKHDSPTIPVTLSAPWTSLIWQRLRQDGWCPSELARFFMQLSTQCLLYLSNLQRPGSHESHDAVSPRMLQGSTSASASESEGNRESLPAKLCTAFKCAHRQMNEDEYQTKHACGCDGCDDVVADPQQLSKIIEQGKVPLILSIDEGDKNTAISFVEGEPGLSYIAISHVWSDGLGNLRRNALPRCQLLRLSNMIRNLPGQSRDILLFWCDTICIPPDSVGMADTQALALGQMRSIYADSAAVIVLDSWLFNDSMAGKDHIEILMKIFCCGWNTRLWTYQEGALAKSLLFQFSDGSYDLDSGVQTLQDKAELVDQTIVEVILSRYQSLCGLGREISREEKFIAAIQALGHRNTSVASDEPLCLAVLLDMDVTKIARTEPKSRMEKFWRMMSHVPAELVFSNGAHMSTDGLRWAHSTFLSSPHNVDRQRLPASVRLVRHDMRQGVERTDQGVFLTHKGLRFSIGEKTIGESFCLRDENGIWHRISAALNYARSAETITPYRTYGCSELGVTGQMPREPGVPKVAVLVGIDKEQGGIIYCRRLCSCMVERLDEVTHGFMLADLRRIVPVDLARDFIGTDRDSGFLRIVAARSCPSQQRWCVG